MHRVRTGYLRIFAELLPGGGGPWTPSNICTFLWKGSGNWRHALNKHTIETSIQEAGHRVDRFVPRPPFWTGRYQWPCKNSSELERAFQLFYEYITQYMTWVVRWLSILLVFLLWSIIQTDEVDYIRWRKKWRFNKM